MTLNGHKTKEVTASILKVMTDPAWLGKPGERRERDLFEGEYKVLSLCVKLFLRQEGDVLRELQTRGWPWAYKFGNSLSKPP